MIGSFLFVFVMFMVCVSACLWIGFYYGGTRATRAAETERHFNDIHRRINDVQDAIDRQIENRVRENNERFVYADRSYSEEFKAIRQLIADKVEECEDRISDVENSFNKTIEQVYDRVDRDRDEAIRDVHEQLTDVYKQLDTVVLGQTEDA